tara:strand:+ start:1399 stop:2274 length:876 start_codon:yes stop_codon:yes gene_type:complete
MEFKTYVINLDRNKDRWELQSKILSNVNIKSERFSGYTFKDINKAELLNKFGLYYHLCSESMIGCAYSHLKVLENFLETNEKVCLILEDDAYPKFTNVKELNIILKNIYDNILIEPWDIYSLHSDGFINDKIYNYNNLLTMSCAAYFITRQGAINLLKNKVITHSDLNININNLLGNVIKKIHIENLFYTNEELCSDNRKENTDYTILDLILNNTLFNKKLLRGEKKWKHIRNYTFLNIPFINYNLTNNEIIKKIFILHFILINVKYPSNKNKILFFLSILLITSNKNITI